MREASLNLAQLTGTKLVQANLRGAELLDSTLHFADLSGADCRDANLAGANMNNANLHGTRLGDGECAPKTGQISSKIENRPIGAFQVHELLELDRRTIAD